MGIKLEYAPAHEHDILTSLVDYILDTNAVISVNDGEETVLKRSDNRDAILEAMTSTGEDKLIIFSRDGKRLGVFYLIYNNGSEDYPLTVIADYSSNDYCDAIMALLEV